MTKYVMQFTSPQKTQYPSRFDRFMSWAVTFIIVITLLLTFSKTVHAGLLSFITTILGSEQVSAKVVSTARSGNSQTIALPQPAVNHNPNPERVADTMPTDDGETLIADMVATDADESVNTQISTYVVRSGDTLSGIADMFDVSVNTIRWANNISKGTSLRVGQNLIILPVTGISYTVKKGDTIKAIVSKYSADTEEVLQYNDLTLASTLTVGQVILIPDVELSLPTPTKKPTVAGSNPAHDTKGPSYPGYYARPIKGGTKTQGLHGNNAVDLADKVGTPIYAAAEGNVIVSLSGGWDGGYGDFIIISHANGTQTLYAHNSKNLVKVGDHVEQGQQIALMGATGKATGPHVHFEIRGAQNPF